jgi:hypothetical protein
MNRCWKVLRMPALWCLLLMGVSFTAQAQVSGRPVPQDVRFGMLVVTQPPNVTLDGQSDRLSPGSRIRQTNAMLLLSASAVGQNLPVLYKRDAAGLIHEAWVLTADEARQLDGVTGAKEVADAVAKIFGNRR